MKRPAIFKKGFKAVKEEEERREKEREARRGKLWRVFFPKDADEDFIVPVTFLTEEPICYYEHTVKVNGKITHRTCTGEGCKDCENDNNARFMGAFLVVDHTHFQIEERDAQGNKTGKKKTVKAKVKVLARGQQDLAVLDRLNKKKGLLDHAWEIYKTGKDTSTKWNFDNVDLDDYDLSDKEIKALLPEELRDLDYEDILMKQILPSEDDEYEEADDDNETDEELRGRVNSKIQNVDDDEEEEEAPRSRRVSKSTKSSKASSKSSSKSSGTRKLKRSK